MLEGLKTLIVMVLGLVLGAGLAKLPILLTGSSSEGTLIGILLCSVGLTTIRPNHRWIVGFSIGFGMVLYSAARTFGDIRVISDVTEGAMFDFGLAVIEGMVPAFFGIILGTALLRAMPRAATLGVVMIAAAYGGQYLWSENTSERQIENEKSARTKIQRLIEAQESYRLSNVIKGYSCNLMELGQTFENVVEFEPRYAARYSRATDGIFIYDLVCVSKGKRIDKFVLIARTPPSVRSSRYAYCADETGVVRELDRRVATSCMPGGVIPPGKMIDIETFIANKKLKN